MADVYQQHGAFSWCELMTDNVEGSVAFYTELLNWETEAMQTPDGGDYTVVKAGGECIAGIMQKPEVAKDVPNCWGTYITVDNVDAAVKRAEGLGAKKISEFLEAPGVGRFCVIQDPQGAVVSLITYEKK